MFYNHYIIVVNIQIQTISNPSLDLISLQLVFSVYFREWYSYHFPELYKIVPENYLFAKVVKYVGDRKQLTDDKAAGLEEIIMDAGKAAAILSAAKSSMGIASIVICMINTNLNVLFFYLRYGYFSS